MSVLLYANVQNHIPWRIIDDKSTIFTSGFYSDTKEPFTRLSNPEPVLVILTREKNSDGIYNKYTVVLGNPESNTTICRVVFTLKFDGANLKSYDTIVEQTNSTISTSVRGTINQIDIVVSLRKNGNKLDELYDNMDLYNIQVFNIGSTTDSYVDTFIQRNQSIITDQLISEDIF